MRHVIPAKAGTYWRPSVRESGTYPMTRHSRESGNLPPPSPPAPSAQTALICAQTALICAQKVLIQRSRSAHSALIKCSLPPDGADRLPGPSGAPRPNPRSRNPRARRNPFPRLLQASRAIMTQPHCVPLRLLLSWTPIERPGRPARRTKRPQMSAFERFSPKPAAARSKPRAERSRTIPPRTRRAAPVSPNPQGHVIPAKAGTYP